MDMKKLKSLFLIVGCMFSLAILNSCSKDNNDDESTATSNSTLATTPTAIAANDNSSAGVYKGIVVGSSGYFQLKLKNGNDSVNCKLVFDNYTVNLTTISLSNWTAGQAIQNAIFTGVLNGATISINFSCDANGLNPVAIITIPGHTTHVVIVKEKSNMLVKCYLGTYSNQYETGIWNFVTYGETIQGCHQSSSGNNFSAFTGKISNSKLTLISDQSLSIGQENLILSSEDKLSGTVVSSQNTTVTVAGERAY